MEWSGGVGRGDGVEGEGGWVGGRVGRVRKIWLCARSLRRGGGGEADSRGRGDERTLEWRNAGDLHPLALALQCVCVHG